MALAVGAPERTPLSAAATVVAGLGLAAWVATLLWAAEMGMGAEPGTMGLGVAAFVAMWTLMMAAMMLPAVSPLVSMYDRTIVDHRPVRLGAFGLGYVLAWSATGSLRSVSRRCSIGWPTSVRVSPRASPSRRLPRAGSTS